MPGFVIRYLCVVPLFLSLSLCSNTERHTLYSCFTFTTCSDSHNSIIFSSLRDFS